MLSLKSIFSTSQQKHLPLEVEPCEFLEIDLKFGSLEPHFLIKRTRSLPAAATQTSSLSRFECSFSPRFFLFYFSIAYRCNMVILFFIVGLLGVICLITCIVLF